MDWKTFIVSIVSSLAWPILVLFIFITNKDNLKELIKTLKSLKAGDFEFNFSKDIEILKNIQQINLDENGKDILLHNIPHQFQIIQLWKDLELGIYSYANKFGIDENHNLNKTFNKLLERGLINPKDHYIILNLKKLRNEVVHSHNPEIDLNSVLEYGKLVNILLEKLK